LPARETSCHEEEKTSCSLVPDVVCRNVTQTRFDEKCWTVEEEMCRTVYDTVWDKKCETVNITVPQTECDTIQEMVMEEECKVVNDTVRNQVCVTVMDQEVQEVGINSKFICTVSSSFRFVMKLSPALNASNNPVPMCLVPFLQKTVKTFLKRNVKRL
jgi:hypothetical protein